MENVKSAQKNRRQMNTTENTQLKEHVDEKRSIETIKVT